MAETTGTGYKGTVVHESQGALRFPDYRHPFTMQYLLKINFFMVQASDLAPLSGVYPQRRSIRKFFLGMDSYMLLARNGP